MYKAHARHLLAIAFVIYLFAALLATLLGMAGAIGTLFGVAISMIAMFLLQATLIKAVQGKREGRREMSVGDTVSAATPYLWPVTGASLLAGLGITIGLTLLIVPGLVLMTIWAVVVPVIVVERSRVLDAFGRSQQLVRGNGWPVFGTLVLLYIIQLVVGLVVGALLGSLPGAYRDGLGTVIAGTLIAPFAALVVTLIYYRLTGDGRPGAGASGSGEAPSPL